MANYLTETSNQRAMSTDEVISYAKSVLAETTEKQLAALEGGAQLPVGYGPQPGDTLDLGEKGIGRLPSELIHIIKDRVERLSLGHNRLHDIPSEIVFCSNLLYLNLRHNQFDEFPEAVLDLRGLQILDLSHNNLTLIPDEIQHMQSLMFLAVEHNHVRRLPVCLGDMPRLMKVKAGMNPLEFPPPEVLIPRTGVSPDGAPVEEARQICSQIKAFMREHSGHGRRRAEVSRSNSESNMETPRPPKRSISGRFPVRPSIGNIEGVEHLRVNTETGLMPPPPVPQRTRIREPMAYPTVGRRPGLGVVTADGERNRSRSDTAASAASHRSKRLGYVPRKPLEGAANASINETGTIRALHYRGPSQLSNASFAMHSGNDSSSGAVSPVDAPTSRHALARRRLSSLPEDRRASRPTSMTVKLANRLVFMIAQIHPAIGDAIRIIKSGTPKKTTITIERSYFEAATMLEGLDRRLHQVVGDTGQNRASEHDPLIQAIRRKCAHVLGAYAGLASELRMQSRRLTSRGEPMYIRNLLIQMFAAMVEIRNMMTLASGEIIQVKTPIKSARSSLATSSSRSVTPTQAKPFPRGKRSRGATLMQPSKLTTPGSIPPPVPLTTSRSNTMTSMSANVPPSMTTPVSGESFSVSMSRSMTQGHEQELEEQRQFEAIYLKLDETYRLAAHMLPACRQDFFLRKEGAARSMQATVARHWAVVLAKCDATMSALEALKGRLMSIKFKDPAVRNQRDFWQLCDIFVRAWTDLALEIKTVGQQGYSDTDSIKVMMRPVQRAVKEVGISIHQSPLYQNAMHSHSSSLAPSVTVPGTHHHNNPMSASGSSSGYVTPVPATPLSAALGPAALATVPSTPSSTALPPSEYFVNTMGSASMEQSPWEYERVKPKGYKAYAPGAALPQPPR